MRIMRISGALAACAWVAVAFAQDKGQNSVQTARAEAELLGFQRFVGTFDFSGTWKGQATTGVFKLLRNSSGDSYSFSFEGRQSANGSIHENGSKGLVANFSGDGVPALPEGKATLEGRAFTLTFGPAAKPNSSFSMRWQSRSEAILTFTDLSGMSPNEVIRVTARKR